MALAIFICLSPCSSKKKVLMSMDDVLHNASFVHGIGSDITMSLSFSLYVISIPSPLRRLDRSRHDCVVLLAPRM